MAKNEKVVICVDSASGYSEAEARKLNLGFIPLVIESDFEGSSKIYKDGVLDISKLKEMLESKSSIKTSTPKSEWIINEWNDLLKKYDKIIQFSISSELSGTNAMMKALANEKEYQGKVLVIDSLSISSEMQVHVKYAKELIEEGKTAEEITSLMNSLQGGGQCWFVPGSLERLKAGGRVSGFAAALAGFLKIHPVLLYSEGRIQEKQTKKIRTMTKALNFVIDSIKKVDNLSDYDVVYSDAFADDELLERTKDLILTNLSSETKHFVVSNAIKVHIGNGTIGICLIPKIK